MKVIITGGWMDLLRRELEEISGILDPDLTLKGLQQIYRHELCERTQP